ncbi:MAG: thioredoxin family protein [Aureliella sp.]
MKFRLRSLLMFVFAASIASLILRTVYINRPARFEAYSPPTALKETLNGGKPVIVSLSAAWSAQSRANAQMIEQSMGRFIRDNDVTALQADWTNPSQETENLMEQLDVVAIPAIAIFNPEDSENPIVITGQVTHQQIRDAIHSSMSEKDRTSR